MALHRWLFVGAIALLGALTALWLGDMFAIRSEDGLAVVVALLAGIPGALAALPRRLALGIGLIPIVLGLGWAISVFNLPGDGAIGGVIVLALVVMLALLLGVIVGLGTLVDRWAARRRG